MTNQTDKARKDAIAYQIFEICNEIFGDPNTLKIINMIENSGLDINYQDVTEETFLHIAVRCRKLQLAKYLIETRKVELNLKNEDGATPLILACDLYRDNPCVRDLEIIEYLLKSGADIDIVDDLGYKPIHFVAVGGDVKLAKLLIQYGARIDEYTEKGESILDLCSNYPDDIYYNHLNSEKKELYEYFIRLLWNI